MNNTVRAEHDYQVGLNTFFSSVYNLMALNLGVTALIAWYVMSSPSILASVMGSPLFWVAIIAELAIILVMAFKVDSLSSGTLKTMFFIYSALSGLTIAPLVSMYTPESVFQVFLITSAMFAALSFWGFTTKKDLSAWGKFLFMAVIGLIVAMLINMFVASSTMSLVISLVAVVVFAGLTAYDTQKLKDMYHSMHNDEETLNKVAIMGAVSLYLDFINLFIHLLRLLGSQKD